MANNHSRDHSSSYVCDTLPPPRLASGSTSRSCSPAPGTPPVTVFDAPIVDNASLATELKDAETLDENVPVLPTQPQPPARKLCARHQRMADEGTNLKLQQALDALPVEEREAVNTVWSNFSSSPHPRRALILQGLLTMCCFSQLSLLTEQLSHLIRIDPFTVLPREVSLKILGYLDATSLCRAAQVNRQWKSLADDDILWRGICEQHIGQKCLKCGWGLPILEKRRTLRMPSSSASPCPSPAHHDTAPPSSLSQKRELEASSSNIPGPPMKRRRKDMGTPNETQEDGPLMTFTTTPSSPTASRPHTPVNPLIAPDILPPVDTITRPWKDVYCERLTIERNWRRGRCTVRTLKGHTDGVMCLQFNESLEHPAFPVLISGSYDRTARVWNLETGAEVHCLTGHTRAVRALQFDEAKLITGSMDRTMRVWNWRTGKCLRTLEGHTEGVVCLNFDKNVLASGSVDTTVKVWNLRTGECFTLRGHCDWVNAVQLWDASGDSSRAGSASASVVDDKWMKGELPSSSAANIDPGKMLFSASDDGTIRLWDLAARSCVRLFKGHVGQVQSLKLLVVDDECGGTSETDSEEGTEDEEGGKVLRSGATLALPAQSGSAFYATRSVADAQRRNAASSRSLGGSDDEMEGKGKGRAGSSSNSGSTAGTKGKKPVLISGSLDNTIKLWDIDTGKAVKTLFGHIEGVWAVASDKLRLVSGSHDRTIKVWVREEGRCMATLVGHRGAVTCLALGEDKIVSGSDDGDIRLWSFAG